MIGFGAEQFLQVPWLHQPNFIPLTVPYPLLSPQSTLYNLDTYNAVLLWLYSPLLDPGYF
jgi:hypothetical protein